MSKVFYLRDTRSNTGSNASFWSARGGYTTNLNDAEIFSEERAMRQHQCRETDLPVAVAFLEGKTRQRVDHQYVTQSIELHDSVNHVVIVANEYDGNDVLFIGQHGHTFEFNQAEVFSLEDVCKKASESSNYRIAPYENIAAIVRSTVHASEVQPELCAQFSGFKLVKPEKSKKPVYNCHGCGRFMSEYQLYAMNCPNCDAENRP